MIPFECPNCGGKLRAGAGTAGERVVCPHCASVVPAPSGGTPTEAAAVFPPAPAVGPTGPTLAREGTQSDSRAPLQAEATPDVCRFLAPAQGPNEIGRLGPYPVLKVLGLGGMGVVLLVHEPQLERRVALKMLRPELAAGEAARKRFLREARAAAAIQHDHIVPIFQVGEAPVEGVGSVPYLTMPFLQGEPLNARLEREK